MGIMAAVKSSRYVINCGHLPLSLPYRWAIGQVRYLLVAQVAVQPYITNFCLASEPPCNYLGTYRYRQGPVPLW